MTLQAATRHYRRMPNHVCLPDIGLIREVTQYQIAYDANPPQPFFASSTLAFNTGRASIKLDGRPYSAACVFCVSSEPTMRLMEKGEGEVILVDLRVGALYRLFGVDGAQFRGSIVEVEPRRFPQLESIYASLETAPKTIEGRVTALDRALLSLAKNARPYGTGEKFQFVADLTKGAIRVDDAAKRLGVSVRTLERDCRMRFGRTPKRILRGWRIAHAMSTSNGGPVRWMETDPDANYSDQSHFLRDYRELGGMNPTEMHKYFRGPDPEVIFYPRGDLSASTQHDDLEIAAEYDANSRFWAFGPELVQELGLTSWEPTRSTLP